MNTINTEELVTLREAEIQLGIRYFTARGWWRQNKYPEIFREIKGAVFIHKPSFEELVKRNAMIATLQREGFWRLNGGPSPKKQPVTAESATVELTEEQFIQAARELFKQLTK